MTAQKSDFSTPKKIFNKKEIKKHTYPNYEVKNFLKKLGIDISALQK